MQPLTSLPHAEQQHIFSGPIDPGIAPLVTAMNRTGLIRTYGSCEGHWYRARYPYVAFHASIEMGRAFARLLREDPIAQPPQLLYEWCLEPCFNQDYELCYRLSCPQLEFQYYWRSSRIRHDIQTLASMILHLANHHRP